MTRSRAVERLQSLAVLRLRLTAWYVATFCLILTMLGTGLYQTMRSQLRQDLDASLRDAVAELARAARTRESERARAGRVVDAFDELRIPDRTLYLLDSAGTPIKPASAPDWVRQAAIDAAANDERALGHEEDGEPILRLYAKRFRLANAKLHVGVAVADEIELEDKYASLIAAFGAASVAALLLIAIGGWFLVRESTRPIERSVQHMRQFMADAAHELRTPLTVVRSRADISLQQERPAAEYVAALRAIAADSERLGRIVDDLLTLASADAGERSIEKRLVYLDDIVLDAADGARLIATARGVSLEIDGFEEAAVDGDPALLRQMVMILLDNAIKFTPVGGAVRIGVGSANGRAKLVVNDTGVGVPPDQIPHVFERFYRGDPARPRHTNGQTAGEGAGLGLSIARWISDAHGATIEITSASGAGTRATVIFPERFAASTSRRP